MNRNDQLSGNAGANSISNYYGRSLFFYTMLLLRKIRLFSISKKNFPSARFNTLYRFFDPNFDYKSAIGFFLRDRPGGVSAVAKPQVFSLFTFGAIPHHRLEVACSSNLGPNFTPYGRCVPIFSLIRPANLCARLTKISPIFSGVLCKIG